MYIYLQTLEGWDKTPRIFIDLIGKIKQLNVHKLSFKLYAEDTDIELDCISSKDCRLNTDIHSGDTVIINGHFTGEKLIVTTVNKVPFNLSGNLQKDVLILTDTLNSMCSAQAQNKHISYDQYGTLQEILFEFKDAYHEILFLQSGD